MQECIEPKRAAMAAFWPIDFELASMIAKEAEKEAGKDQICDVANINSPQQVLLIQYLF